MPKKLIRIIIFFSYPLFFLITLLLFKAANIQITERSLSFLGSTPVFGKYFDITLVLAGTLQLVIFASLFVNHKIKATLVNIIPFVFLSLTTIAGIFTGIITDGMSRPTHLVIAVIGFSSSFLGWTLFGLELLINKKSRFGLLMIVFGSVMIPIFMLIYRTMGEIEAIHELIFFLAAYITDLVIYKVYFK